MSGGHKELEVSADECMSGQSIDKDEHLVVKESGAGDNIPVLLQEATRGHSNVNSVAVVGGTAGGEVASTGLTSSIENESELDSISQSALIDASRSLDVDVSFDSSEKYKAVSVSLKRVEATDEQIAQALRDMHALEHEETSFKRRSQRGYNQNFTCYICTEKFSSLAGTIAHGIAAHGSNLDENAILKHQSNCNAPRMPARTRTRCGSPTVDRRDVVSRVSSSRKPFSAPSKPQKKTKAVSVYQCPICRRVVQKQITLLLHMKEIHKTKPTDQQLKPKYRSKIKIIEPRCSVCGHEYRHWHAMYRHMRTAHPNYQRETSKSMTRTSVLNAGSVACPHCSMSFASKSGLYKHKRHSHQSLNATKQYSCVKCQKNFRSSVKMDRHNKMFHKSVRNESSVSCNLCGMVYRLRKTAIKHLKSVHRLSSNLASKITFLSTSQMKKEATCRVCNITFPSPRSFFLHMKQMHLGRKTPKSTFKCSVCIVFFKSRSTLYAHTNKYHKDVLEKKTQTAELPVNAPSAPQTVEQPVDTLSAQSKIMLKDCVFPCHLCGTIVHSKKSIERHLSGVHSTTLNVIPIEGVPLDSVKISPSTCVYCGVTFDGFRLLYIHLKTTHSSELLAHQTSSTLDCKDCELKFQDKEQLQHHMGWCHQSIRNKHDCKDCELKFQEKEQLQHHMGWCHQSIRNKHGESELAFPCSKCGKILRSLSGLESHMRMVHFVKGSDFVMIEGVPKQEAREPSPHCRQCDEQFGTWKSLYNHFRKRKCGKQEDTSGRSLHCSDCSLTFRTAHLLYQHNHHFHKVEKLKLAQLSPVRKIAQKSDDPIVCSLCNKEYQDEDVWFQHLGKIHYLNNRKCKSMREDLRKKICSSTKTISQPFAKQGSNKIESTSNLVHPCEICGVKYFSLASLERHQMKYHRNCPLARTVSSTAPVTAGEAKAAPAAAAAAAAGKRKAKAAKTVCYTHCTLCSTAVKYIYNMIRHYINIHGKSKLEAKAIVSATEVESHSKVVTEADSDQNSRPFVRMEDVLSRPSSSNLSQSAAYDSDSDTSSSDSSGWIEMTTDLETTSSDDSSSDESEDIVANQSLLRKRKWPSSSSSSSSSDESLSDAPIPTVNQTFSKSSSVALSAGVKSDDLSAGDSLHVKDFVACETNLEDVSTQIPLLGKDQILQLDDNIFLVDEGKSAIVNSSSVNRSSTKSSSLNTASQPDQGPSDTVLSAPKGFVNYTEVPITSTDAVPACASLVVRNEEKLTDLDSKHEKRLASVDITNVATVQCVSDEDFHSMINQRDRLADEEKDDVVVSEAASVSASPELSKLLETATTKLPSKKHLVENVFQLKDNSAKNAPIAVLRPFSGVPEVEPIDNFVTNAKDDASSNATRNVPALSSKYPSTSSTVDPGPDVRQFLSTATTLNKHPISLPVYLVNSSDFIVPCFVENEHIYRRISLATKAGLMKWIFQHWYDDLSVCRWGVIALLPEAMSFIDQIDNLMKWLMRNKIASLPFSMTKIPRLDQLDWVNEPSITIVSGYDTVRCSSICCLCGALVRSVEELQDHAMYRHQVCSGCNQLINTKVEHSCTLATTHKSCIALPKVKFVQLSNASSVNCQMLTLPTAPSRYVSARSKVDQRMLIPLQQRTTSDIESEVANAGIQAHEVITKSNLDLNVNLARSHIANTSTAVFHKTSGDVSGLRTRQAKVSSPQCDDSRSVVSLKKVKPASFNANESLALSQRCSGSSVDSYPLARQDGTVTLKALKPKVQAPHSEVKRQDGTWISINERINEQARPYRCHICDISYMLKLQFDHHVRTLHKKCTICDCMFSDRQERSEHITKVHASFICLACDHTCSSNEAVKGHIIRDHVDLKTGLFNCVNCDNKQIHPEAIVDHLKDDDMEQNSKCHLCSASLRGDKASAIQHFFSHTLHKSSCICLLCGQLYVEPWMLRWHILKHYKTHFDVCLYCLSISSSKCTCDRTFAIDEAVTAGARKGNEGRALSTQCLLCWQTFLIGWELREHCNDKHSQHGIQCDVCGQRFEFAHQRQFHMTRHRKAVKCVLCTDCGLVKSTSVVCAKDLPELYSVNRCGCTKKVVSPFDTANFSVKYAPTSNSSTGTLVEVEVENVKTDASAPGNLQLELDGKLYNFISDEEHDGQSAVTNASMLVPTTVADIHEPLSLTNATMTASANDKDHDTLYIDESDQSASSPTPSASVPLISRSTEEPVPCVDTLTASTLSTRDHPSGELTTTTPAGVLPPLPREQYSCLLCSYVSKFKAALNKHVSRKHNTDKSGDCN